MRHVAFITGASEGLGKAFALACAQRQYDLVLAALPNSGLKEYGRFLRDNFDIQVKTLEADLSDIIQCQQLLDWIIERQIPVSILINNLGVGGQYEFDREDLSLFNKMIDLNIRTTLIFTHGLIPLMQRNSQQCYILNVGSIVTHFPGLYKQIYGATKSFINYFSKALRQELMHKNIQVSVLNPSGVHTNIKMLKLHDKCSFFQKITLLYPESVADYALERMLKGNAEIIPGRAVRFLFSLSALFPKALIEYLTFRNNLILLRAKGQINKADLMKNPTENIGSLNSESVYSN